MLEPNSLPFFVVDYETILNFNIIFFLILIFYKKETCLPKVKKKYKLLFSEQNSNLPQQTWAACFFLKSSYSSLRRNYLDTLAKRVGCKSEFFFLNFSRFNQKIMVYYKFIKEDKLKILFSHLQKIILFEVPAKHSDVLLIDIVLLDRLRLAQFSHTPYRPEVYILFLKIFLILF